MFSEEYAQTMDEKRVADFKAMLDDDGHLKSRMPCRSCQGKGKTFHKGFTSVDGKVYPDRWHDCVSCENTGYYDAPSIGAIVKKLKGRKGLRTSAPPHKDRNADRWRSYYVWRLARFHGGADVTMPMTATLMSESDPYRPLLDYLAEKIAKNAFGTDMAAAFRWANALGGSVKVPNNMPETAYSSGPVHDGNKPEEEIMELF